MHYTFDSSTGTLAIGGSGPMTDFASVGESPLSEEKVGTIVSIVFEEGNTVTSIGDYAFYGCKDIVNVDMTGTQIETIGGHAFYGCEGLVSVGFPTGLTSIGQSAFHDCAALENVDLSDTQISDLGTACFSNCGITAVKLPVTLKTLNGNAFNKSDSLSELVFYGDQPEIVTSSYDDSNVTVTVCTTGWGSKELFEDVLFINSTVSCELIAVPHLSYDLNGGSGTVRDQYGLIYLERGETECTLNLRTTEPTGPDGRAFLGWSTDRNSATGEYGPGDAIALGGDVALCAVWESDGDGASGGRAGGTDPVHAFTVYYDANGGDGAPAAQRHTSTSARATIAISSVEPTRPGYTFLGWSTDPNAESAEYPAGGSVSLASDGSFSTSVTLYAVWAEGSASGSGTSGDGGSGSGSDGGSGSGSGSGTSSEGSDGGSDLWYWIAAILIIVVLVALSGWLGYRARNRS